MSNQNAVPKTVLGTKLTLGVKERMVLMQMRPQQSDSNTQFIAEDIEKKTGLSKEEKKKCGYEETKDERGNTTGFVWNGEKEFDKEFIFSDAEVKYLIDQKNRFETEKRVTPQLTSLFRRLLNLKIPEDK